MFIAWPNSWNKTLTWSKERYCKSSGGKCAIKYPTPVWPVNFEEPRSVMVAMFWMLEVFLWNKSKTIVPAPSIAIVKSTTVSFAPSCLKSKTEICSSIIVPSFWFSNIVDTTKGLLVTFFSKSIKPYIVLWSVKHFSIWMLFESRFRSTSLTIRFKYTMSS